MPNSAAIITNWAATFWSNNSHQSLAQNHRSTVAKIGGLAFCYKGLFYSEFDVYKSRESVAQASKVVYYAPRPRRVWSRSRERRSSSAIKTVFRVHSL